VDLAGARQMTVHAAGGSAAEINLTSTA